MNRPFKLGATVAMGAPAGSPFPLNTDDYCKSAELLKSLGYDSMEIHIRAPQLVDGMKIKAHCESVGISISSIGTGQAYGMEGLSITAQDPKVRAAAVQRLKEQLDLAKLLDCPIIIGSMHGVIGSARTYDEVNGLMIDSMGQLADYAERTGTEIVIEAIDRFESDYLQTAQEVLALIEQVGSSRIMVHLDTYHMNLEERDWRAPILLCRGKLGHVHLADNRRYYPGWGLIDFKPVLLSLMEIGYDKSLTMECYPYPDGITALRRAKRYIDGLLSSILCDSLE
ncbi:MAG: sugar phosphate isomerase/epimerase family protein [Clostridia bacterium]|nr:sugar phosphate isomerase/epimerase family protein [Clostridia bacterium]